MLIAGDTIFIKSGPNPEQDHMFVVLNDPKHVPTYGTALIVVSVSLSTIRTNANQETTCCISPNEHPFVIVPSYVYYRDARILRSTEYINCINSGYYRKGTPVSKELLKRIISGLFDSRAVSKECKNILLTK